MSLLMMVASSSAFRRSMLPPNGSPIEPDWSRRKMKHPGFLRLISALYMLTPRFRPFSASFDLHFVGFDLPWRNVELAAMGCARGQLLCLDDRECRRRSVLAERPMSQEPPDQAQRNQREPGMEQFERATNLGSSASRTGRGPPLRKPGQ